MRGLLMALLGAYLIVWVPFGFAGELLGTLPSLRMRGAPAIAELLLHGVAALLSVAAGWMLWIRAPAALSAAAAAVIVTGAVSVQSVLWTVLPRNVAPGEKLPLAVIACLRTALWLVVLAAARGRDSDETSLSSGRS